MAEQRKRYGGAGHRNPNRKAYDGHVRPERNRPLPADFRDLYIRHGWDAERLGALGSKVRTQA